MRGALDIIKRFLRVRITNRLYLVGLISEYHYLFLYQVMPCISKTKEIYGHNLKEYTVNSCIL